MYKLTVFIPNEALEQVKTALLRPVLARLVIMSSAVGKLKEQGSLCR